MFIMKKSNSLLIHSELRFLGRGVARLFIVTSCVFSFIRQTVVCSVM